MTSTSRAGVRVSSCRHPIAQHVHGTRTAYIEDGCRCSPCTAANHAYGAHRARQIAYGRWHANTDATQVRGHVHSLLTAGLAVRRIAQLAGVSHSTVTRLLYGRTGSPASRVWGRTARALLAVTVPAASDLTMYADRSPVDGLPTRRKLQALIALGWTQAQLADRLGKARTNLGALIHGTGPVQTATAGEVDRLYRELCMTLPPQHTARQRHYADRTRNYAHARGWAPPLAWDDIDDPAGRANGLPRRRRTGTVRRAAA